MITKYFKGSKYGNESCRCISGHTHQSRFEAAYCTDLELLKRAGEIRDYEIQVKVPLYVNGELICTHYPDFLVTNNEGGQEYHETKGFEKEDWRIKRKLTEALYPEIPYIVVRDVRKKKKSRRMTGSEFGKLKRKFKRRVF